MGSANRMAHEAHVLLVTDDAGLRTQIHTLLRSEPRFVVVADIASGVQAASTARELEPDLIVMDLLLPDSNGLMMTRVMRRLVPDSQVILLISLLDYRRAALESGAFETVLKSELSACLVETLRRACEARVADGKGEV